MVDARRSAPSEYRWSNCKCGNLQHPFPCCKVDIIDGSLGHRAITTCSPANFDLVRSYGADAVFDYKSATCAQDIKRLTRNSLKYAIDPFAELKTMNLCYESIGRVGGRYTALEMFRGDAPQVKTIRKDLVMGPTILGAGVDAGEGSDYAKGADPELRQWGINFYQEVQRLVDEKKLRVHPVRVLEGRFEAILMGLGLLKRREVSGQKLVVRI